MQTSTIKFSQIEDRIDAEYYKPEYLEILNTSKRAIKINEVANVTNGAQPKNFNKGSIKFFSIKDLDNIFLNDTEVRYIGNEFFLKNPDGQITKNDILLAITGATIGKVAISDYEKAFISGDLAKIRCNKVFAHYLVIFFLSRFGQNQIYKNIFGATNKHLSIKSIKNFYIEIPPQSFQQKIEKMVKEAQEKRKLADEKYKEAEEILNKELGLEDLNLSTQKTFEAKFSETEDRFDPEYYQSKYKKIILKLKLKKSAPLDEIVKIRKGVEVGHEAYTNEGIPFIRVQDFDEKELVVGESTNYIRSYLYEELKKKHKPNAGEIIFSKDGTVGRAFVIREDNNEFIVSGGILILTPRNIDNYYLAFVLNSLAVKSQTIRESIGAIIQHLSVEEVKNLKIPILSQSFQQKISSLIQESFKLRQEAKELIKEAKFKVEEMIEKKETKND